MGKFLAVFLGVAMFISGVTSAAIAADFKIGFVDINKAANESEKGIKAQAGLKDFLMSKQAAIGEKGKAIEKMKADLEKQASIISPEARRSKLEEIERADRDFQRVLSDSDVEFEKKRREATESVYKEIFDIVEKVGQEQKYDVILPGPVLYINKSLDITADIIKKYNDTKESKAPSKKGK